MSKPKIGDVVDKVIDVGSNVLPVPGGKIIGDVVGDVINKITDGKGKSPGRKRGQTAKRPVTRRCRKK